MTNAQYMTPVVAAVLMGLASSGSAATVNITMLDARFENPTFYSDVSNPKGPLPQVTNDITAPGSSLNDGTQISWGKPWQSGGPQSNYVFDPRDVIFAAEETEPFAIGTLVHNNYAIKSNSRFLDTVDLSLSMLAEFEDEDGNKISTTLGATFKLGHTETPNFPSDPSQCSTEMKVGPGSSSPRCSDQVTLLDVELDEFSGKVGDEDVYLELLGFGDNLQSIQEFFWTTEGMGTSATLFAQFSFKHSPDIPPPPPPPPSQVPLPAAIWLLLAGWGSLAVAKRAGRTA